MTISEFNTKWNIRFPDNDTFEIGADDLREFKDDLAQLLGASALTGRSLTELVLPLEVVGGGWYLNAAGIWEGRRDFTASAYPVAGPNWRSVVSFRATIEASAISDSSVAGRSMLTAGNAAVQLGLVDMLDIKANQYGDHPAFNRAYTEPGLLLYMLRKLMQPAAVPVVQGPAAPTDVEVDDVSDTLSGDLVAGYLAVADYEVFGSPDFPGIVNASAAGGDIQNGRIISRGLKGNILVSGAGIRVAANGSRPAGAWMLNNKPFTGIIIPSTPTPTGDTVKPEVTFTVPAAGATLAPNSQVLLTVTAKDNVAVQGLIFTNGATGAVIGSGAKNGNTYTFPYTTGAAEPLSLVATATDAAGNSESATVNVTVGSGTAPATQPEAPTFSGFNDVDNTVSVSHATLPVSELVYDFGGATGIAVPLTNVISVGNAAGQVTSYARANGTRPEGLRRNSQPFTLAAAANNAPTVTLSSPQAGQSLAVGEPVVLNADPQDADGTADIKRVDHLDNGVKYAETTGFPHTVQRNITAGAHSFTARVYDMVGASGLSNAVQVTGIATTTPNPGTPRITGFTPNYGKAGDKVSVFGELLGSVTGAVVNGTAVTSLTQVSATQVNITIPVGATTGTISLQTSAGFLTSSGTYTVIAVAGPIPYINPQTITWDEIESENMYEYEPSKYGFRKVDADFSQVQPAEFVTTRYQPAGLAVAATVVAEAEGPLWTMFKDGNPNKGWAYDNSAASIAKYSRNNTGLAYCGFGAPPASFVGNGQYVQLFCGADPGWGDITIRVTKNGQLLASQTISQTAAPGNFRKAGGADGITPDVTLDLGSIVQGFLVEILSANGIIVFDGVLCYDTLSAQQPASSTAIPTQYVNGKLRIASSGNLVATSFRKKVKLPWLINAIDFAAAPVVTGTGSVARIAIEYRRDKDNWFGAVIDALTGQVTLGAFLNGVGGILTGQPIVLPTYPYRIAVVCTGSFLTLLTAPIGGKLTDAYTWDIKKAFGFRLNLKSIYQGDNPWYFGVSSECSSGMTLFADMDAVKAGNFGHNRVGDNGVCNTEDVLTLERDGKKYWSGSPRGFYLPGGPSRMNIEQLLHNNGSGIFSIDPLTGKKELTALTWMTWEDTIEGQGSPGYILDRDAGIYRIFIPRWDLAKGESVNDVRLSYAEYAGDLVEGEHVIEGGRVVKPDVLKPEECAYDNAVGRDPISGYWYWGYTVQIQGGGHFYPKIVRTLDFVNYEVVYDGFTDPLNREGVRLCKFGDALKFLAGGPDNIAIISLQGVLEGTMPQPVGLTGQEYASHAAIYSVIIGGELYYEYLGFTSDCHANASQLGIAYDNENGGTRPGQRFAYGTTKRSRSKQHVTI